MRSPAPAGGQFTGAIYFKDTGSGGDHENARNNLPLVAVRDLGRLGRGSRALQGQQRPGRDASRRPDERADAIPGKRRGPVDGRPGLTAQSRGLPDVPVLRVSLKRRLDRRGPHRGGSLAYRSLRSGRTRPARESHDVLRRNVRRLRDRDFTTRVRARLQLRPGLDRHGIRPRREFRHHARIRPPLRYGTLFRRSQNHAGSSRRKLRADMGATGREQHHTRDSPINR